MLFNSIEFLIFLPIAFILFWIFPKKYRWMPLLISSYVFYMFWDWRLVTLILITTIVSYLCGILLEKYNNKPQIKKIILFITIILCLGILIFFKYFNFIYDMLCDVIDAIGMNSPNGFFTILLPVGISFYTFQTLSYVIDIYSGKIIAEKHFGYYALFVSFFPQLVAGPIERPNDLLPQLRDVNRTIKKIDYYGAFRYILIGLFKKIAVADIIGIVVNNTYNDVQSSNGLMVMISTVLFSFQIFCDFSGYSDIARGSAKLFCVELSENFKEPYKSKSIKEFWQRWHISLSQWFRDYIYFPLGGSRVKKIRWCINILIVFIISGLWHGANYTFVIWGLLHAVLQIIGSLTLNHRNNLLLKMKVNPDGNFVSKIRTINTFILICFTWIFFRANNISDAGQVIKNLFTDYDISKAYFVDTFNSLGLSGEMFIYIILVIPLMLLIEKIKYIETSYTKFFSNEIIRYGTYLFLAWCTTMSWIYLQATSVGSSFIYFQF